MSAVLLGYPFPWESRLLLGAPFSSVPFDVARLLASTLSKERLKQTEIRTTLHHVVLWVLRFLAGLSSVLHLSESS